MILYTSNYARKGADENSIAISCSVPEWYNGRTWPVLAPTWEMVDGIKKGRIDQVQYTKMYLNLIQERGITPEYFSGHGLHKPTFEEGTIFLCYEPPLEFCHRRVLAEWVMSHTDIIFEEWKNEKELKVLEQLKNVDSIIEF